mmetsp:Transcript_168912/g.543004  ORF Transcript_168912/g.543004 Transcript_168912/m.543004 type:complete len:908 (-) Transcript_168912:260-2983(-)
MMRALIQIRPLVVGLFAVLAATGLGVSADGPDHHAILGLGPEAKQLDTTLAYIGLTKRYRRDTKLGSDARLQFVEVQQAFEALADDQMKQEALDALEYSDHVHIIRDDAELQFFTQLQPGGSAHVRVVFLLDNRDEKHWQVLATATQLNGNVRVGQLCHKDASDSNGSQGPFLSTLKLRQFPSALIYDPISRAMTISYGLDGVREEVQKFLEGRLHPSDKLARVQELDTESYRIRCASGSKGRLEECKWALVLATNAAIEANQDKLLGALRTFAEACRTFHTEHMDLHATASCFWLRSGREAEWKALLRRQGMGESQEVAVAAFSFQSSVAILAAADVSEGTSSQMVAWFNSTLSEEPAASAYLASLPPLPWPVGPTEEPAEGGAAQVTREARRLLAVLSKKAGPWLEHAVRDVMRMNNEDRIMVAGAGTCCVFLVLYLLRSCCRGGRNRNLSEEQVMKSLVPILQVNLSRQDGERLGMGIGPGERDCLMVTGISKGDVIDRHNAAEPNEARRILEADRIVSVAAAASGQRAAAFGEMSGVLKANNSVSVGLVTARSAAMLQRSVFMLKLQDVPLGEADLRPPALSWGGAADDRGVEIATVGAGLAAWNEARWKDGLCCTQRLQVGDRIISANGNTDVRPQLAKGPSPLLLVARWWPVGSVEADRFEVSIERPSPEDRLGMHLRVIVGLPHYQVVEVFPEGAVARRNAASGGGRQILPGDRIVAINGAGETKAMEAELQKPAVALTIERWVDRILQGAAWSAAAPAEPLGGVVAKAPCAPAASNAAASPSTAPRGGGGRRSCCGPALNCLVGPLGLLMCLAVSWDDISKIGIQRCLQGELMDPERYVKLALTALGVGSLLVVHFLWYEFSMLSRPLERGTCAQLITVAAASACLGYGNWFLRIWAFA